MDRKRLVFIVAFFGAVLLLNLPLPAGTVDAQRATREPIRIGVINSVTGLYAVQGLPVQQGLLLARDQINAKGGIRGRRVELIFEDDGSNPDRAVRAFRRLAGELKVSAIIGPLSTSAALATAPLADRYGVVMVVPTARSSKLVGVSKNLYMIYPPSEVRARTAAGFATQDLKAKRVAILLARSQFTDEFAEPLKRYVREAGGEVVSDQRFDESETNLRSYLQKAAAGKPDVLIAESNLPVAPVAIVSDARLLGRDVRIVFEGAACVVALSSLNDRVLPVEIRQNLFFVNESFGLQRSPAPAEQEFMTSFRRRFNVAPTIYSGAAEASLQVVANALDRSGFRGEGLSSQLRETSLMTSVGNVQFVDNQVNSGLQYNVFKLNQVRRAALGREMLLTPVK